MENSFPPLGLRGAVSRKQDSMQPGATQQNLSSVSSAANGATDDKFDGRDEQESPISLQDLDQIRRWNSVVPRSVDRLVQDVFTDVVKKFPSALAIDAWDGQLSYAELDIRSSLLASYLRTSHGLRCGHIAFVLFERSLWTSVAVLAVIKAGSMFVLLNSSLPDHRLKHLTAGVNAHITICSPSLEQQAGQLCTRVAVVEPESQFLHDGRLSDDDLMPKEKAEPDSLLYGIFTSGSTGEPKMVTVSHSNLLSGLTNQAASVRMDRKTRSLDFASYSFDVSIHHMLAAFTAGACLCVPSEETRTSNLEDFMVKTGVNFANMTPSSTRLIRPEKVPNLQTLVVAGELVTRSLVEIWAPHVKLVNAYGPAECSIFSTFHECSLEDVVDVPIGRGHGCVTWVVSPDNPNQLLPIGQIGELVLEGPIVGQGYHNNLEANAKAFVREPDWLKRGALGTLRRRSTLYKTGDLVRYESDGNLVFVGRKDLQVKIRGQRVELGEIENQILSIEPQLSVAIVELVKNHVSGISQLVAFLKSTRSEHSLVDTNSESVLMPVQKEFQSFGNDIQCRLVEILPSYMVPTVFVSLKYVPLTPSGKVDRRLLNKAGCTMLSEVNESIADDLSDDEVALRDLWSLNLSITPAIISSSDNYFMLGGDSISAIHLISVARQQCLRLNAIDILRFPTLKDMAVRMVKTEADTPSQVPVRPISWSDGPKHAEIIRDAAWKLNIKPEDIEDVYPCTPMQEGLLSLTAKRPGAYIVHESFSLHPGSSIARLHMAWKSVVQANKILRTRLIHLGSCGMMQVVMKDVPGIVRISNEKQNVKGDEAEHSLSPEGSLFRVDIIQTDDPDNSSIIMTAHHAICDEWQIRLILDQVEAVYGETVGTTKLEFATFVEHLQRQDKQQHMNYWKAQLGHEPIPAIFPDPPPVTQTYWASRTSNHVIAPAVTSKTSTFTLPTKLRLAVAVLLGWYTNSTDVVFGSILNGRNASIEGVEKIVGPTITTVPLRVKMKRSETILQSLKSLHQQSIEMVPFEQSGLQAIRKISSASEAACNIQTLLVIQQVERDCTHSVLKRKKQSAENLMAFGNVALFLECTLQASGGVEVKAAFDESVLTLFQVQRLLWQLDHILGQVQMYPERQLGNIDCVSPQDVEQITSWQAQKLTPTPLCLHEMFRKRCLEQYNDPVIYAWDREMTYRELDETSSRLALYLHQLELGREPIIPQLIEKSALGIVCELAVLKCGGACLTLDSAHPEKRLSEIIRRTKATVVLSSSKNIDTLKTSSVRLLEVSWSWLTTLSDPQPEHRWHNDPRSPAFLVFTSGSTGKPKGIILEHEALATTTEVHAPEMNIVRGARVLHFASPSFDVSIYEVLMTLLMGACLCVPSDSERMNDLALFVHNSRANVAMISPTLLGSIDPTEVPSLKTIILVGEAVPKGLVSIWTPHATVMNGYGPGECTFCSTTVINGGSHPVATVGKPTGCKFWIVDVNNHKKLAPIGAVGEIAIQGPTLARGYLDDPIKTEEAFVDDISWSMLTGVYRRTYFSGDLGYYNADGSVVYVGRVDAQVKLRGQRIELGEVNYHLQRAFRGNAWSEIIKFNEKPELTGFVVVPSAAIEDSSLILGPSAKIDGLTTALAELQNELPAYMVPSVFLPVRNVPRTTSGKYDRNQLLSSAAVLKQEELAEYRNVQSSKRHPSTHCEVTLREIWAEVLKLNPNAISVDDSFFNLGGNSVDAMKLVSTARKSNVLLSVATIFKHPRLCDLAQACNTQDSMDMELVASKPFGLMVEPGVDTICERVGIQKDDISDMYPATLDQVEEFESHHTIFAGFGLHSRLDVSKMVQSWARVVQENDVFRTVFVSDGESTWAVVKKHAEVRLDESKTHLGGLSQLVTHSLPTCWAHGELLFELVLINCHGTQPSLVLKMSHSIFDGQSLPNIWSAWRIAYEGIDAGVRVVADGPRLSFQDILHSRQIFAVQVNSIQYWRELLSGSVLTILPSASQPRLQSTAPPLPFARQITNIHAPRGCVLDSLLKAAWATTLALLTRESDIVFWQLKNGRRLGASSGAMSRAIGMLYLGTPIRVRGLSPVMRRGDGDGNGKRHDSRNSDGSVFALCLELQAQDARGLVHEALSDEVIWRECTSWDSSLAGCSILNHVECNIEGTMELDGVRIVPEIAYDEGEQHQVNVLVQSEGERLDIEVTVPVNVDPELAGRALGLFCDTLERFSRAPEGRVFESD